MSIESTPNAQRDSVAVQRLVRPHAFIAPRGYAEPDGEYRSCFNFVWWFWLPRIHTQQPDTMNPRVIRLIWLCFAVGLDIWGKDSRMYWPNDQGEAQPPVKKTMNTPEDSTGGCCPPQPCSADPFPKWKWMMDYCRERRWPPSDFWDLAEKAWREKFEPNAQGDSQSPDQ